MQPACLAAKARYLLSMAAPAAPAAEAAEMDLEPREGDDIIAAALKVLHTADPHEKARRTDLIVQLWQAGRMGPPAPGARHPPPPDRPARESTKVKLVHASQVPKRGKGGSLASRQALLHSLVHIENAAVDLAWDIIARFGSDPSLALPRDFFDDFVKVAADECRHFALLEKRLQATGSFYGAMPAHDGLWASAQETAGSLAARLAVEHCTHEARGLDVLPQTIHRFRSNGDAESADLLQDVIYKEEIGHVAAGIRWLRHLHALAHSASDAERPQAVTGQAAAEGQDSQQPQPQQPAQQAPQQQDQQQDQQQPGGGGGMPAWAAEARAHPTVEQWFHTLIRRHFWGPLKPPFNEEARAAAGFGPEWYLPLAADAVDAQQRTVAAAVAAGGGSAASNGHA